jgi:hypothetical protein
VQSLGQNKRQEKSCQSAKQAHPLQLPGMLQEDPTVPEPQLEKIIRGHLNTREKPLPIILVRSVVWDSDSLASNLLLRMSSQIFAAAPLRHDDNELIEKEQEYMVSKN